MTGASRCLPYTTTSHRGERGTAGCVRNAARVRVCVCRAVPPRGRPPCGVDLAAQDDCLAGSPTPSPRPAGRRGGAGPRGSVAAYGTAREREVYELALRGASTR
ncbi:hypothetical protein E2C01_076569 [Portunus trituberculatus]|uniref:Uncharacterized protein n=1 Tax=Portunus trituberculatus TaxID=210409 RepID=A0A5B7IME0_PORTR|nr:hypothetical protein [Portunus trituberculatus]